MLTVRKSEVRQRTELDWLESRHTFSFDQYYEPAAMGFSVLRVLNDDCIAAGAGFPTHCPSRHADLHLGPVGSPGASRQPWQRFDHPARGGLSA
nr:hypothetical protein [Verrucomicrobium sp. 3C]